METVQAVYHRTLPEHLHMKPEHGAPGLSQFESYSSEFLFTLSFPRRQQAHTPCPQAESLSGVLRRAPFCHQLHKGRIQSPEGKQPGEPVIRLSVPGEENGPVHKADGNQIRATESRGVESREPESWVPRPSGTRSPLGGQRPRPHQGSTEWNKNEHSFRTHNWESHSQWGGPVTLQ